jgi:hypothetical protein
MRKTAFGRSFFGVAFWMPDLTTESIASAFVGDACLMRRTAGLLVTGGKRDRAEKSLSQIPSSQIATMVPSVARPLMVHPVA